MQQILDRAVGRQLEADAVFVLHHAHGDLEQFDDDRGGLSLGQFRMDQDLGA